MFKIWKWNTFLFVCQALIGGVTYIMTGAAETATLLVAATTILAVALFVFEANSDLAAGTWLVGVFGAVTAFFAVHASTSVAVDVHFVAAIAAAVTFAIFAIGFVIAFADIERDDDSAESSRVVAALPLGIGTVLGGLILLFRKFFRKKRLVVETGA